jgi:hypothetical protein
MVRAGRDGPLVDEFDVKLDRLERILRGTERYGSDSDASESDQAMRFQIDEMLDEIVARTRGNMAGAFSGKGYDLLVSLSGFTPMATILICHLLQPRQLLVIGSEETRSSINVIDDALVKNGPLSASNFNHAPCDPTNPRSIYGLIKAQLDQVEMATRRRPTAIIDITGGKKVMSAAAALAAWQLDLPLCYMDGTWSPRLRQHLPGKDKLLMLPNPAAIFGDREMDRARVLFDSGSFDAAEVRYAKLVEDVPGPARARFMAALSGLYQAWCDLDLDGIAQRVSRMRAALAQADDVTTSAVRAVLEDQFGFLDRLASGGNAADLVLCFAVLGQFYLGRGRKDFAAMLIHRALEGALLHRLSSRVPDFDCGRPDYTLFPGGADAAMEGYEAACKRHGLPGEQPPPTSVGMLDAVLLLDALGDPMLGPARLSTAEGFQELGEVAAIRNGSVLARGNQSVSQDGLARLVDVTTTVLDAYWQQHGDGQLLSRRYQRLAFIKAPF